MAGIFVRIFQLRVDLCMGRKIIEVPEENEGFCGSRGLMSSACPQDVQLRVGLSMGKKVIEIFKSMKNSGGAGG